MSLNARRDALTEEDKTMLTGDLEVENNMEDILAGLSFDDMGQLGLNSEGGGRELQPTPNAVAMLTGLNPSTSQLDIGPSPLSSQMTLKQAFQLLLSAVDGKFEEGIPTRRSASPIYPSVSCFYVDSMGAAKKKRKMSEGDPLESSISVKYQSFFNSEVYWSPNHGFLTGICARGMSKRCRKQKDIETSVHGYQGRWFSLLRRTAEERDSDTSKNIRAYVVQTYSLVQFWKTTAEDKFSRICLESKSVDTDSLSSDQFSLTSASGTMDYSKTVKGNMQIVGDLMVQGDLTMQNLHVKGDLLVEGSISGQLVTPPGAADYAEWFMYLNPKENIQAGMVVQLRSPEQKITLDTSGEGPLLVVSTTPSVAAGVPPGNKASKGALCAFIGQVPVRVRGRIRCGDFIFPSGNNDGFGVPGSYVQHKDQDPLGTAMVASEVSEGIVLAFVRWQHNIKWRIMKDMIGKLNGAVNNMWLGCLAALIMEHFVCGPFLYFRPDYRVDRAFYVLSILLDVFAWSHYPHYKEFALRGDVFGFVAVNFMRCLWASQHLIRAMNPEETSEDFGPIMIYVLGMYVHFLIFCYNSFNLYMNLIGSVEIMKKSDSSLTPCGKDDKDRSSLTSSMQKQNEASSPS